MPEADETTARTIEAQSGADVTRRSATTRRNIPPQIVVRASRLRSLPTSPGRPVGATVGHAAPAAHGSLAHGWHTARRKRIVAGERRGYRIPSGPDHRITI